MPHVSVRLLVLLACLLLTQRAAPGQGADRPRSSASLEALLAARVKSEWEALKNKDKNALGQLLADDFVAVEVDGQGTRTRSQTLNELDQGNVSHYSLFGLSVVRLGEDAALATYEVTMEFPPKAQTRFLRVYVSEIWIHRAGTWKLRHYQETRVK